MTDTFDFVVVGAGSGGCAVAGRLSEETNVSVAVLDAGGKNDNWVVTTPFALVLMVAGNVNNWAFSTVPQKGLNGRIGYQPRGKGLGGSSAINAMVYIRGHRADYDQWAALGNAGWSFADVLPYFKRAEDNSDFDGEYHGKGGPLAVNKSRTGNPVQQIFLQAAPVSWDACALEGGLNHGADVAQVIARGKLWHDAAVRRVRLDLAFDHVA